MHIRAEGDRGAGGAGFQQIMAAIGRQTAADERDIGDGEEAGQLPDAIQHAHIRGSGDFGMAIHRPARSQHHATHPLGPFRMARGENQLQIGEPLAQGFKYAEQQPLFARMGAARDPDRACACGLAPCLPRCKGCGLHLPLVFQVAGDGHTPCGCAQLTQAFGIRRRLRPDMGEGFPGHG